MLNKYGGIIQIAGVALGGAFGGVIGLITVGRPDYSAPFAIVGMIGGWFASTAILSKMYSKSITKDFPTAESLYIALKDEDPFVRETAVKALGKLKEPRSVKPLILSLKDFQGSQYEYTIYQEKVIDALAKIVESDIDQIISFLRDSDSVIRGVVAGSLSQIGWKPIKEIDEAYFLVALKKWKKVKKLGPIAEDALVNALKGEASSFDKQKIMEILGGIGWEPNTDNEKIQFFIIQEKWDKVAGFGSAAVNHLIDALNDEDSYSYVKIDAIKVLGVIKDVKAITPLLNLLNKSWVVSQAAGEALAKIGKPSVQPLIDALKNLDGSESWNVKNSIKDALAGIGEPAVEPLIKTMCLEDFKAKWEGYFEYRLHIIIEILEEIGDKRAIVPLAKLLKDCCFGDDYLKPALKKAIIKIKRR